MNRNSKVAIIYVNRTQMYQGKVIDISSTIQRFPNITAAEIYFSVFKDEIVDIDSNTLSMNVFVIESETVSRLSTGAGKKKVLYSYRMEEK